MRLLLIILVGLLPFAGSAAAAEIDDGRARAIITAATVEVIRPAYRQFAEQAAALRQDLIGLCASPGDEGLEAARSGFSELVQAWSQAEVIRFGPITADNRLERLLFWPDRRGIGLRQVQAILAEKDETAADAASLAGKSVAVQGFGALEFVLFGTGSDQLAGVEASVEASFRCRYGAAIAVNLEAIAGDLRTEWEDRNAISALWVNFGPENERYRSAEEALGELVDVVVHGLEQARDVRLNGFLGNTQEGDKPRSAIYWRSAQTMPSLSGNLAAMHKLLTETGIFDLVSEDGGWIPGAINYEFANAQSVTRDLREPVDLLLANPQRRVKLELLRMMTSSLTDLVGERLTGDIGLTVGFSSLDGD